MSNRGLAAGIAGVALSCLVLSPTHLIQHSCPVVPLEAAPGGRHLRWFSSVDVLASARALMADRRSHGFYGTPPLASWTRMHDIASKAHLPPAARATGAGAPWRLGLDPDDVLVRPVAVLPSRVRALDPLAVAVSSDAVVLTWRDDRCYPYGYGLILLADGAVGREGELRASDRRFRRNVEVSAGLWSYYLYH